MSAFYQERPGDSPFVENFSSSQAERDTFSLLPPDAHSYLFVMKHAGKSRLAVGGPLTRAMYFAHNADTEWVGVRFKLGAFMPLLPASTLLDTVTFLPEASSKSFWLYGSVWEYPTDENSDVFVNRLVRQGLLMREPLVEAALRGDLTDVSPRSVQRRFIRATGVPQGFVHQVERAQTAITLLQQGTSILDTVAQAGYFDQAHLTHALKRFMGQTPTQIARSNQPI